MRSLTDSWIGFVKVKLRETHGTFCITNWLTKHYVAYECSKINFSTYSNTRIFATLLNLQRHSPLAVTLGKDSKVKQMKHCECNVTKQQIGKSACTRREVLSQRLKYWIPSIPCPLRSLRCGCRYLHPRRRLDALACEVPIERVQIPNRYFLLIYLAWNTKFELTCSFSNWISFWTCRSRSIWILRLFGTSGIRLLREVLRMYTTCWRGQKYRMLTY